MLFVLAILCVQVGRCFEQKVFRVVAINVSYPAIALL